jgi:hypothetical protein
MIHKGHKGITKLLQRLHQDYTIPNQPSNLEKIPDRL